MSYFILLYLSEQIPNSSKRGKQASPKKKASKKKQKTMADLMHKNDQALAKTLSVTHGGKRILLTATQSYQNIPVPIGEEDYLFLYFLKKVNADGKTVVIGFSEKYVVEGGTFSRIMPSQIIVLIPMIPMRRATRLSTTTAYHSSKTTTRPTTCIWVAATRSATNWT